MRMRAVLRLSACGALMLLTLQLLARWVPPLQSPDELSHLIRAASIAEGQWLAQTEPGVSTGGSFDIALSVLARVHVPVIKERDPAVKDEDLVTARTQGWTGRLIYGEAPGSAIYLPVIYAPAALGLAAGRAWDWTIAESYHLARLSSQLFCVLVVVLAVWVWPPPLLAWALLLLPMSLFQLVSPVVDGPAHALTLLAMSLLMRLRQQPAPGLAAGAGLCLLVLVTARMHLLPLLLLPFWWAWQSHESAMRPAAKGRAAAPASATRAVAWAGAASLMGTLLWAAWASSTVVDTRVQRTMGNGAVALHYLLNPEDLWDVFARTFADEHRPSFLLDSFIGNLGWLDTRLPDHAYGVLWWALAGVVVLGLPWREPWRGTVIDRLVLLLCALGASSLVFLLMLITWSPFPTHLIEGVQGRYFIAPAIVAAYALGSWKRDAGPPSGFGPWQGVQTLVIMGFALVSVMFLAETLLNRYPAWARGGLFG